MKRLFPITMILALMLTLLAGCGNTGGTAGSGAAATTAATTAVPTTAAPATPAGMLMQVSQNMNGLKNFDYAMNVDMAMSMNVMGTSQDLTMTIKSDGTVVPDPNNMLSHAVMNMTTSLSSLVPDTTVETYMKQSGDQLITYTNAGGAWTAASVDMNAADMTSQVNMSDSFLGGITADTQVVSGGAQTVNGVSTTKYDVTLPSSYWKNFKGFTSDVFSGDSVTDDMLNSMLSSLGDLTYTCYVDSSNHVVRIEMDMKNFMTQAMNAAMAASSDTSELDITVDISKCNLTMDMTNYGTAAAIVIPQEALDASTAADAAA